MYVLTLHLKGGFTDFAFCINTDLSSIFLGDRGDGECVTLATMLNLILGASSDRYTVVEPSHDGVRWGDSTLENSIFSLHCSHIVQFGGQSH